MTTTALFLVDGGDDIGAFKAVGGLYANKGRFKSATALDIGEFSALSGGVNRVEFVADQGFGLGGFRFKARAVNQSDPWSNEGFPTPHVDSYTYSGGPDLVRTTMESGLVRQRRRWTDRYRKANVSFTILASQLGEIEAFLDEKGYDWFNMPLVTGTYDDTEGALHIVRVMENPTFDNVFGDTIRLSLVLEVQNVGLV